MSEYFKVQLPSKGLPYDVDPSKIKMTYTTGEVEELLAGITLENYEGRSLMVLNKIITGIDPKKLTLGDRLALLIQNTVNTYSKYFEVDVVCSQCGAKHPDFGIDLTKIDLNEIDEDGFEPRKEIECFGKKAYVHLFTMGDQMSVDKYMEEGGNLEVLYSLSKMVDIVKEVDEKGDEVFYNNIEKFELFKNSRPKEYQEIKLYGSKYDHGSFMTYKFKCSSCGQRAVAYIPFLFSLLYPGAENIERSLRYEAEEYAKNVNEPVPTSVVCDGKGVLNLETNAGEFDTKRCTTNASSET